MVADALLLSHASSSRRTRMLIAVNSKLSLEKFIRVRFNQ